MSGNSPLKNYTWQIFKAIISFGVVIVYSRYLGASGRGEMSVLLLYLQIALMIGELLAGSAMANWLVKYKVSQILPWVASFSFGVILISGFVLNLIIGIRWNLLLPLLIQGFALAWLNIQYNIYQSRGWIRRRNQLQLALELSKLFLLISVVIMIPRGDVTSLNVQLMLEVLASITMVILGISMYKTRSIWQQAFSVEKPPKGIFFEGILAQLGHFVLFLLSKAPLWLIAEYLGNIEAGIFANALLIADTIWIFSGSFGTIIHARVIRNDKKTYHERLLNRYIVFSMIGTIAMCILMIVTPNIFFTSIFGVNFTLLKYYAMLSVPGIIFVAMASSIGNYLHATNRFKELLRNHILSFFVLIATIFLGFQYEFRIEMVALGMNLSFLTLLILHLYTLNWLFKRGLQLKFNILLISRLISIKVRNK